MGGASIRDSGDDCLSYLAFFQMAQTLGQASGASSTEKTHHLIAIVRLAEQRIELLGKLGLFRDQGEAMCEIGSALSDKGKLQKSSAHFQPARNLGARHVFFSA